MARTDAERLELYLTLRDQIDDALLAGSASAPAIIRYRIGNREVQREATKDWLAEVEAVIARLTVSTTAASGPARNYARRGRF